MPPKPLEEQLEDHFGTKLEKCASSCYKIPGSNRKVFVKVGQGGSHCKGDTLHRYEFEGLKHLRQNCVGSNLYVPEPLLYGVNQKELGFICVEYLDIKYSTDTTATNLGRDLARMHKFNCLEKGQSSDQEIGIGSSNNSNNDRIAYNAFGFHIDGACGAGRQLNDVDRTSQNWVEFWRDFRLGDQLQAIKANYPDDREIQEIGAQLMKRLPELFSSMVIEDIAPSVLHGDLWSGNYGAVGDESVPVIFDPAVYYGHHEADLGIAKMFGGFGENFWDSYHSVLPKSEGFERRSWLYELHHHLNHYQIFGRGYRSGSLSLMQRILQRK